MNGKNTVILLGNYGRNKVLLLGNLGADPAKISGDDKKLAVSVRVATNEYAGKDNPTHTEWHTVTAFGHDAEYLLKYGKSGALIDIEGRLRTRKKESNDGGEDRYYTGIVATEVRLLSGKASDEKTNG